MIVYKCNKEKEVRKMKQLIVNNLNQLKKQVKPGMVIESINYLKHTHEKRTITRVNTISIISKHYVADKPTFGTVKKDESGMYQEYYTDFEKAKNMCFNSDGSIDFLTCLKKQKYTGRMVQCPGKSWGFELGQPWLTIKIYK